MSTATNALEETKKTITIKEGTYTRQGKGIAFHIGDCYFFAIYSKTYRKSLLKCRHPFEDTERCTTISGLKAKPDTENAFYFDVRTPSISSLKLIDSDFVYYQLIVHPETIEIARDSGK